jgi:MoaA/NifB/PqqE/SkfB family radical SAM enzyme
MNNKYIGWHIELSRRCPIRCPACPRTFDSSKIPDLKRDINVDHLFNFFKKENMQDIVYMQFQGNLGDPIYHPQFHRISEHFFDCQNLNVTTNGMHTDEFWEQVFETWPEHSTVTLSIDGLKDTNHIYRVNSNWNSIESLFNVISTKKRKCKIEWKFIVFEHNYHQIEEAHALSKSLGMNYFRIQKSRKLDETTNLNGTISEKHLDNVFGSPIKFKKSLQPFCMTGDMHYITAEGIYKPCCWLPDFTEIKNWTEPNISDFTIDQMWQKFLEFKKSSLVNYKTAHDRCKLFCSKLKNKSHDNSIPSTQIHRKILKND